MSEDLIIKHCAPTLAGLKTGNIFNASYESEDELGTEATEVLRRFGYVPNDPDSCIEHLADRIAQFSKCTGVYLKHMKCGAGLEKLAVRKH